MQVHLGNLFIRCFCSEITAGMTDLSLLKACGFMAAGPLCSLVEHMPGVKPCTRAPTCNFLELPLLLESTNFLLIAYDCSLMQAT